jgi:hypothetical protein
MTAQKRIEAAKGAVFGLLYDAYKRGDKIAFIAFRGESSETFIPPKNNIDVSGNPFTPNYINDIIEAANVKHIKVETLTKTELQRTVTELLKFEKFF